MLLGKIWNLHVLSLSCLLMSVTGWVNIRILILTCPVFDVRVSPKDDPEVKWCMEKSAGRVCHDPNMSLQSRCHGYSPRHYWLSLSSGWRRQGRTAPSPLVRSPSQFHPQVPIPLTPGGAPSLQPALRSKFVHQYYGWRHRLLSFVAKNQVLSYFTVWRSKVAS